MLWWKWILVLGIFSLFTSSALAEQWKSRYYQQGGQRYYYAPAQTYNTQSYLNSAQSGCTHGPNGSTCRHGYDVNRSYSVDQGGSGLVSGRINYNGAQGTSYSHNGSPHTIAGIDQREQANADLNKKRMEGLDQVAELKANLEQRRANLIASGARRDQVAEIDTVLNAYGTTADQLAAALQSNHDAQMKTHLRSAVDWGAHAFKQELNYMDRWEQHTSDYATRRKSVSEAYITFELVKVLLK